jgi:hypothetical protein
MRPEAYNPTAAEWLAQADRFLDRDGASDLKRQISESLRARAEKARLEFERLQNELRGLGDALPEPESARDEDGQYNNDFDELSTDQADQAEDLAKLSARELVIYFAGVSPGAQASNFADFLRPLKGDSAAKHVHSTLYEESKPGGPLRKEGAKPNTKYFLANPRERHDAA